MEFGSCFRIMRDVEFICVVQFTAYLGPLQLEVSHLFACEGPRDPCVSQLAALDDEYSAFHNAHHLFQ